jgi:tetratricopeptide (TPR) repeat protein
VQTLGAQQQHDGLQIHPEICPLGQAQVAVDVAEQGGGRAEAVPVRDRGPAFPKSAIAFDSLGEAYMQAGNKKLAIENYEKSLKLDADNKNAEEMLKKLRQ